MSEMYQSVFKLPLIQTKDVRVVYSIATQTIALHAGSLCRYRTQAGDVRSFRSFQGYIRPLKCCQQNRDSPKKTILYHSCIQFCRSAHPSRRLLLCCIVKGSRRNIHQAYSSRCCKCRRTVRVETGSAANMPMYLLMAYDVIMRFFRADLTM